MMSQKRNANGDQGVSVAKHLNATFGKWQGRSRIGKEMGETARCSGRVVACSLFWLRHPDFAAVQLGIQTPLSLSK